MAKKDKNSAQKRLSKIEHQQELQSKIEEEFFLLQTTINKYFEDTTNKIQDLIEKKTNN